MNGQHDDHASDRSERERSEADQNPDHRREAPRDFYPGNHGFEEGENRRAVASPQSPAGEAQRYGQTHAAHGYYEHRGSGFEQGGDARYEHGRGARYEHTGDARHEHGRSGQYEGDDARHGYASASYEHDSARFAQRYFEPRQHERQSLEQPGYGYEAGRWNRGDSAQGQYERDAQFVRRPFDPGHAPQGYDQRTNWSPQHRDGQESYRGTQDPYRGGRDEYDPRNRFPEGLPHDSRARRRYPPGPKGYQRSDARLCEDISERLLQAYHIDSSEVTVEVQGGKVTLEGTVPDRYMKHAIEDLADAAPGVQDIENRIRVAQHPAARDTLAESARALGSAPREDQTSGRPSRSNTSSDSAGSGTARSGSAGSGSAGSASVASGASATANVPGSSAAGGAGPGKAAKRD